MPKQKYVATAFDEKIYQPLGDFCHYHKQFPSYQLTAFLQQGLPLFTSAPNLDFEKVEKVADEVLKTMPYIKQVFSKPWINLKFKNEVLPVEFVKRMNSATFANLSQHPEMISKFEKGNVIPSKLLSKIYIDDYSIYENQVFAKLIDKILTFTRKKDYYLREILLVKQRSTTDFFEKTNHPQYFLALGELHISYVQKYNTNYENVMRIVNLLTRIRNVVVPRLKKPVYRFNDVSKKQIRLRRTNLFYHEKNYSKIYKLYDYFIKNKVNKNEDDPPEHPQRLQRNYFFFGELLTVFSILHFNFMAPQAEVNLENLSLNLSFKGFSLSVQSLVNDDVILLKFHKDVDYTIAVVFKVNQDQEADYYKNKYQVDEAVLCSPFEEEYSSTDKLFVSISNIDSFRRIQQVLLKGMIYSDKTRTVCPFCGYNLSYSKKGKEYTCMACNLLIKEQTCFTTGKRYMTTSLIYHRQKTIQPSDFKDKESWLYYRKVEEGLNFRNITKINNAQEPVCPYCKDVHGK